MFQGPSTPQQRRRKKISESATSVTDELLARVEGELSKWKTDPGQIPREMPDTWLAMFAGVRQATVRRWLAVPERDRPERLQVLVEQYAEIVAMITKGPEDNLMAIASSSSHPQAVRACQVLLPRLDRQRWDDKYTGESDDSESDIGVAGVPREVIDDLTDAELERLARNRQGIEDLQADSADVIKQAAARVAQRAASMSA